MESLRFEEAGRFVARQTHLGSKGKWVGGRLIGR